jgi:imidazolonepropionase
LPQEYANDRAGYVRLAANEILPSLKMAELVDAVDAFMEPIAFSVEEISAFFQAAKQLGLPVKLHADQRGNSGGAALAAHFGALSADHLEYADEKGVKALAQAGTVAVVLPGAFLFLRETQKPPLDLLRHYNVPIALATDCNPGSSPIVSPLAAMHLACTVFGLTPEEALTGMTRNGARALGLVNDLGILETGKCADLAVWSVEQPSELAYWLGHSPCSKTYVQGMEMS